MTKVFKLYSRSLLKNFVPWDGAVEILRRMGCWVLTLLVFSFTASFAHAQVASAALSGRVLDTSGAGIGAATVTVKSVETGALRTVTTDEQGNYRAASLPLGAQEVRAEKAQFKTAVRTGISLVVGQDAVLNLTLELGPVNESVTITDELPVVNTSTSLVYGLVGERQVKELPLNGRSFDSLITLNPSAINYTLKSANTSTSNGNTFTGCWPASSRKSVPLEWNRVYGIQPVVDHPRRR